MDLHKLEDQLNKAHGQSHLARVEALLRAVLAAKEDPTLQAQVPDLARVALGGKPGETVTVKNIVWGS